MAELEQIEGTVEDIIYETRTTGTPYLRSAAVVC